MEWKTEGFRCPAWLQAAYTLVQYRFFSSTYIIDDYRRDLTFLSMVYLPMNLEEIQHAALRDFVWWTILLHQACALSARIRIQFIPCQTRVSFARTITGDNSYLYFQLAEWFDSVSRLLYSSSSSPESENRFKKAPNIPSRSMLRKLTRKRQPRVWHPRSKKS